MKTPPSFLIIGGARCGTTAIARCLEQHPDVFLTDPKEPHFFAFCGHRPSFAGPGDESSINRVAIVDPDAYARLYEPAKAGQATGEGSVSTLYYHARSISNIRRYAPDAKLIAVLRNPIERAWSSYMYMISKGHETASSFREALDAEPQRIANNWHHIWHYAKMGFFAEQLAAFRSAFPSEQLKVVLFDDLRSDPLALYADLYRFLGVDPNFEPGFQEQVNQSGVPKSVLLNRSVNTLGRVPAVKNLLKRVVSPRLRERLRNANLNRESMPADAFDQLIDVFAAEIHSLQQSIGRDLSHWMSARSQRAADGAA